MPPDRPPPLDRERWGHGVGDRLPGIRNDRPDPARAAEAYARMLRQAGPEWEQERAALREFVN